MAQTFDCPSCGASLAYEGDDDLFVLCAYCGSTVVVPEEMQRRPPQQQWSVSSSSQGMTIDLRGLLSKAQELRRVKEMAREGRLEEAAHLYADTFGADMGEANELVGRLASGQSVVVSGGSSSMSIPVISGSQAQDLSQQQCAQVLWAAEQVDRAQQGIRRGIRTTVILAIVIFLIVLGVVVGVIVMTGSAKVP